LDTNTRRHMMTFRAIIPLVSLDLSALPNDGQAKYMRIIGDDLIITPCSTQVGKALDVRVEW
jgi:hypothetical protein